MKRIIYIILVAFILSGGRVQALSIKSETAVLIDGDTGQVLFEKNMHVKMYPASMTKIMTALIALEQGSLSDIISMSDEAVFSVGRDTSHIALSGGERLTLEQALYAAAIASANDASNGIAELIGGSMPAFAELMTARARELGALNTSFNNAHGLPDDAHYTTAHDMARILSAAIKLPEFNKMFSSLLYEMPPTNLQPETRYFNRRNSLIDGPHKYDGVIAEKTGWTGAAGYTYAAAAKRGERTLVSIIMKSPDAETRWEDTAALLDYGFDNFERVSYTADEISRSNNFISFTAQTGLDLLILKSLGKPDINISYILDISNMTGKAVFKLKEGLGGAMFPELGELELRVDLEPAAVPAIAEPAHPEIPAERRPVFLIILYSAGIIICGLLFLYIFLYIRCRIIRQQRRNNNYYK